MATDREIRATEKIIDALCFEEGINLDLVPNSNEFTITIQKNKFQVTVKECIEHYISTPCHFCGTSVQAGYELDGKTRHFLSDCRPDLVEHEPGELCTWPGSDYTEYPCYAHQDKSTQGWGPEHIHFYKDGPMG